MIHQYKATNIKSRHEPSYRENFESGEHEAMADGLVVLDRNNTQHWYVQPVFIPGFANDNQIKLTTDSGASYTFGQLLALSGDFFWGMTQVSDFRNDISLATKQFILNYNTLNNPLLGDPRVLKFVDQRPGSGNTADDQAKQILNIIHTEMDQLRNAIENNQSVRGVFYTKERTDSDLDFCNITRKPGTRPYPNIIMAALDLTETGGGRYLKLASLNNDHFAADAEFTYMIGHKLAIKEAEKGFVTKNIEYYNRALIMDAMACHFLSDTFAGGHARTDARSIRNGPGTNILWKEDALPGLLVKLQHDEENTRGLNVKNKMGQTWITYGDKSLFRPENKESREIQSLAIQASINEIWRAYHAGIVKNSDNFEALNYMPLHGNFPSTMTPLAGYVGEIRELDDFEKWGSITCSLPKDCTKLGPPSIWESVGTKKCSVIGEKRLCQRVKDLNDYVPFWSTDGIGANAQLWRRASLDRDTEHGKTMIPAFSSLASVNAYTVGLNPRPSPILPATSNDSMSYELSSYPTVRDQTTYIKTRNPNVITGDYPLIDQTYLASP